ncbi:MAG TPA: calcium-translocating P-type ATPase, PMCA-type [Cyclobacteriaceae bacterium]|nr:calcium-translocating P-type ATPase, PMCA-type [Cyclobacteriaceae bacterium]
MKYNFKGLSDSEVAESREKYGTNDLSPQKVESFWDKLKENFKNPIIIILCVALVVILVLSFFDLTEWYEAVAISLAVVLATLVSTLNEYQNEASFQKLQQEASQIKNKVFRNSEITSILIGDVVKGDLVLLQAGDKVPADGYVYDGEVKVNQASLTGESDPVSKSKPADNFLFNPQDLIDEHSLFRGAVIEDGEAIMKIEMVGDKTVYGKLSQELFETEQRLSPLQVKLANLAKLISKVGYIAGTLIFFAFIFEKMLIMNQFDMAKIGVYFNQFDLVISDVMHAFVLSIIIIVAAVPEGLPMMIAIVLSLNMRKMLKAKVLVRKLLGIETAGSLNILFSDKTGTITKGHLLPKIFISGRLTQYNSYNDISEKLKEIVAVSIIGNASCIITDTGDILGGNSSERALMSFLPKETLIKKHNIEFTVENNILFNSTRKFSATQVKTSSSISFNHADSITLIKGAAEILIEGCEYYYAEDGSKQNITHLAGLVDKLDQLAADGVRLIAIAISTEKIAESKNLPGNRILVGIIGIMDEIREESIFSIEEANHAGVQVVMITGDRRGTAVAIAKETGLLKSRDDLVLTSAELNSYTDEELENLLPKLRVVARAFPTDKSRLVRVAQRTGRVVGMTGDGVNDSAALKQADVGFAMGSGSEVSKEAGSIVILDDNFKSITNAVRYGRTIFKSIRKFLIFQLTINVAAVTTALLGPFFGIDFPLTIIQILWINIIMDTLAALAFGGEPALKRFMNEPPVTRTENIVTKDMLSAILTGGIFTTSFSMFFLTFPPFRELFTRNGLPSEEVFFTAFFNLFVLMVTFNAFNARTEKINLLEHIYENKGFFRVIGFILIMQVLITYVGGQEILRATPLNLSEWMIVTLLAVLIIPVDLIRKKIRNLIADRNKPAEAIAA